MKMLEIFRSGGPLMYLIFILSVLGVTVIVERALFFMKNDREISVEIKAELRDTFKNKEKEEALEICKKESGATYRVLEAIIKECEFDGFVDVEYLEEKAREAALTEIPKLEKHMWLLGVVSHVTPLVGLLGTVSGMISAFRVIAAGGAGKPELLATGISQALITTAAGLTVAIPALIFYNYFNKHIDNIVNDIEKNSVEIINYLRK